VAEEASMPKAEELASTAGGVDVDVIDDYNSDTQRLGELPKELLSQLRGGGVLENKKRRYENDKASVSVLTLTYMYSCHYKYIYIHYFIVLMENTHMYYLMYLQTKRMRKDTTDPAALNAIIPEVQAILNDHTWATHRFEEMKAHYRSHPSSTLSSTPTSLHHPSIESESMEMTIESKPSHASDSKGANRVINPSIESESMEMTIESKPNHTSDSKGAKRVINVSYF
jgi:hypothetical protein